MASQPERLPDSLVILSFVLGPAATNAYLVGDPATSTAVAIDPAWDGEVIVQAAREHGWRITNIWLTHAHFDHFGGAAAIDEASDTPVPVALHPDDQPLWRFHGGAAAFGVREFDPGPEPSIPLEDGMSLFLGEHRFEVRHTPGHSPGHVILVAREAGVVFCGDLVFQGSVGRTDLPNGSWAQLSESIARDILSLSDSFRLLTGHGPETTVGRERQTNPFLQG